MESKEIIKEKAYGFLDRIWEEFNHILIHGFITALSVVMLAGLHWLFERLLPVKLAPHLYQIEHVLYVLLFIFFGISTLTHLIKSFVGHIWPNHNTLPMGSDHPPPELENRKTKSLELDGPLVPSEKKTKESQGEREAE